MLSGMNLTTSRSGLRQGTGWATHRMKTARAGHVPRDPDLRDSHQRSREAMARAAFQGQGRRPARSSAVVAAGSVHHHPHHAPDRTKPESREGKKADNETAFTLGGILLIGEGVPDPADNPGRPHNAGPFVPD